MLAVKFWIYQFNGLINTCKIKHTVVLLFDLMCVIFRSELKNNKDHTIHIITDNFMFILCAQP